MRRCLLGAAALTLAGCGATTSVQYGTLSTGAPVVELVVTTDRAVVDRECDLDPAVTLGRPVWGCRIQRRVPGLERVRAVKVVRWTDAVPGEQALEIEAHELCHVVAGLQSIPDPCHVDNGGMLRVRRPIYPFFR